MPNVFLDTPEPCDMCASSDSTIALYNEEKKPRARQDALKREFLETLDGITAEMAS